MFQSALTAIGAQQWQINCPYPILDGIASGFVTNNHVISYNVTYHTGEQNYNGTLFVCRTDSGGDVPVNLADVYYPNYGGTFLGVVPAGFFAFVGNSITTFFAKVNAELQLVWLYFNAPAEVTQLPIFTYVQIALVSFVGLGIVFAARGVGG